MAFTAIVNSHAEVLVALFLLQGMDQVSIGHSEYYQHWQSHKK
jgi:hypothetical protein